MRCQRRRRVPFKTRAARAAWGLWAAGLLLCPLVARAEALHRGAAPVGPAWTLHVVDDSRRNPDGVKIADVDGDGLVDVTTGWEEGGVTRVYRHPGHASVRERWPAVTVGATPQAEDAVFVDLDGDGRLDVVTSTEGEERRVYVQWGPKDRAALLTPEAWKQDRFGAVDGLTQAMFALPLDVDGRHGIDLVLGGKNDDRSIPSFVGWLESPSDPRDTAAWRWHPLTHEVSWVMSIEAADFDADGDLDVFFSDKHGPWVGVHWLENPGRGRWRLARPWKRHSIPIPGLVGTSFAAIADLDGDGRRDVVVSTTLQDDVPGAGVNVDAGNGPATGEVAKPAQRHALVLLRKLDDSGDRWASFEIAAPAGTGAPKGVSVGDVDLDGRLDLVVSCSGAVGDRVGVYWLSSPGLPFRDGIPEARWEAHDISGLRGTKFDLVPLADLDGDGDLDVLTTEEKESEKKGLGVVWYENPTRSPASSARCCAVEQGCAQPDQHCLQTGP